MVLYTAQSDLHDMCSDKLNFIVIVVLSVLLFISLTLNVILVVWTICRATQHKKDSVTQDLILQENVTYGVAMQGNGVAKQENTEYDVDVQENVAYGVTKQENADVENVVYDTAMEENITYDVAVQDNVAYDVHNYTEECI